VCDEVIPFYNAGNNLVSRKLVEFRALLSRREDLFLF